MLFLFRFSADSLSDPVCCSFFSAGRSFHRSTRYKNPICLSFPDFAPHRKLCLRSPYVPGSMYLHNAEADYPRTNREYSFTKPLSHIISIMCVTKAAEIKKRGKPILLSFPHLFTSQCRVSLRTLGIWVAFFICMK